MRYEEDGATRTDHEMLTTEDLDKLPCLLRNMVEENGKTIKQNNMERTHGITVGSLVETEEGLRLFVVLCGRDCDGTPLYWLGMRWGEEREDWDQRLGGYPEESLTVVEPQPTPKEDE
jgi:hypothetical protein